MDRAGRDGEGVMVNRRDSKKVNPKSLCNWNL